VRAAQRAVIHGNLAPLRRLTLWSTVDSLLAMITHPTQLTSLSFRLKGAPVDCTALQLPDVRFGDGFVVTVFKMWPVEGPEAPRAALPRVTLSSPHSRVL
jgi:hypothetical protein